MNAALPNATVAAYQTLVDEQHLPDPDDHHVLAAAITGRATHLVTANLDDLPAAASPETWSSSRRTTSCSASRTRTWRRLSRSWRRRPPTSSDRPSRPSNFSRAFESWVLSSSQTGSSSRSDDGALGALVAGEAGRVLRDPSPAHGLGERKRPAVAGGPLRLQKCRSGLLDAEAGDGPGDDELLDLLGALEDVEDLGVAVPALDGVLAGVAVAAEDLDGPLGDPHGGAAGLELGLRALGVHVLAVAGEPGGTVARAGGRRRSRCIMSASMNAIDWFMMIGLPNALRSWAYSRAYS